MSDPSFLERLNEQHEFPGPYTIKIIGRNDGEFSTGIEQTIRSALDDWQTFELLSRTSKNANHISLTLQFTAQSGEQVMYVYGELQKRDDISFLV